MLNCLFFILSHKTWPVGENWPVFHHKVGIAAAMIQKRHCFDSKIVPFVTSLIWFQNTKGTSPWRVHPNSAVLFHQFMFTIIDSIVHLLHFRCAYLHCSVSSRSAYSLSCYEPVLLYWYFVSCAFNFGSSIDIRPMVVALNERSLVLTCLLLFLAERW